MIMAMNSHSQVFLGFQANSIGAGLHLGVQSDNIQFTVGMQHPVFKSENPALLYSTVGYSYKLSDNDNPFSIGLHGGFAYSQRKVVAKDYYSSVDYKEFIPMGNLEIGKQWHKGVLFANCGYASKVFYGIGIKAFF